jgi:hypothetical protein
MTHYDKITPRCDTDQFEDEDALDLLAHVLTVDTKWTSRLVLSADAKLLQSVMKFISHSCDSWYWLIGLGLIGLLGKSEMRLQAAFWVCAILGMAGVVFLIKALFHRPRPEGEWGKIYRIADPHSFPSGARSPRDDVSSALDANGLWLGDRVLYPLGYFGWSFSYCAQASLSFRCYCWLVIRHSRRIACFAALPVVHTNHKGFAELSHSKAFY